MGCRVLMMIVVVATSAPARAGEGCWPRFRGPNGAGLAEAVAAPVPWTDKDYNWRIPLAGVGHSSPVVWGKRVFVTCGNATSAARLVLCLDAADGRTLWQREHRSRPYTQHGDNSYATATPAADANGVVITWTTPAEVILLALDMDGQEVWRQDLGPFVGIHGSGSSPVIVGDLVILANEQEDPAALPFVYARPGTPRTAGKSFLIALDRKTGRMRWQIERRSSQAPYSTPCLRQTETGRPELIFTSTSHGFTAVDAATGKVNWQVEGVFRERCVGSPVAAEGPGGLAFAGHGYGSRGTSFVAIRPGCPEKGPAAQRAYELKPPVPLVPTPLVKGDLLFLWGDDGQVACLKLATGEPVWRQRIRQGFYGSPICAGDRLFCIARNGEVVVLAASDRYELLACVPLGEPSHATPAVADGVIYLRTRSRLYSLGGKGPASRP